MVNNTDWKRYLFSTRWNWSSNSGFNLSQRGNDPEVTLLRGHSGTIRVFYVSESKMNEPIQLDLYATTGGLGVGAPPILPQGVSVKFSPLSITLQPHENVSSLLAIRTEDDAQVGSYYINLDCIVRNFPHTAAGGGFIWLLIVTDPNKVS